ncbi:MAG: hypothetical protein GX946_06770 [Oligosphaeraceae bacterium]|nr:hypothetical protein [Oligosphaeraceae bacterium]
MNKKTTKLNLLAFILLTLGAVSSLQARSVTVKMRDVDRALLVSDMVLRTLFPTRVVVEQSTTGYDSAIYGVPAYSGSVTTTTTVINPSIFTTPLYVTPRVHYVYPQHYVTPRYYRGTPHYSAPRHHPPRHGAPHRRPSHSKPSRPGRHARPVHPRR